ncbi:hypothetical protein V1511DRAFT_458018 [Dipodascopsis uninucleata]
MHAPSEDEVISGIQAIKAESPGTGVAKIHMQLKEKHPNWSLSAERVKRISQRMNAVGRSAIDTVGNNSSSNSADASTDRQRTYAESTIAGKRMAIQLPSGVEVVDDCGDGRGKSLRVGKGRSFIEGDELWTEAAAILVPPLSLADMVSTGRACSRCARPIEANKIGEQLAVSCGSCRGRWCTNRCRKEDKIHKTMRHGATSKKWRELEEFAIENQWTGVYLYGWCLAAKNTETSVQSVVDGLAKVRQDVRQASSDDQYRGSFLVQEQHEMLWQEGYEKIKAIFPDIDYDQFMYGIGMVNINNLDGSIYAIQSHLNHSCDPSVDVKIIGRTVGVKVLAKRDLHAGDELTTTYIDTKLPVSVRRQALLSGWGFWCECKRCLEEAGERKKRRPKKKLMALPKIIKNVTFDDHVEMIA